MDPLLKINPGLRTMLIRDLKKKITKRTMQQELLQSFQSNVFFYKTHLPRKVGQHGLDWWSRTPGAARSCGRWRRAAPPGTSSCWRAGMNGAGSRSLFSQISLRRNPAVRCRRRRWRRGPGWPGPSCPSRTAAASPNSFGSGVCRRQAKCHSRRVMYFLFTFYVQELS
jgi:hypothetical protein